MTDHDPAYLVAGKYSIEDLVDLGALECLFQKFSAATGFTTGFLAYPSQKVLIKTGWRDACVKFHRVCPASAEFCKESNVELSQHLKQHQALKIRECGLGLVDGATPIIVRGTYIAYLATGQVFFSPPDLDRYRENARQFGFDAAEYLQAIQAVPVVSETQFRAVLTYLSELATLVAEEGLLHLEKQEQNAQLLAVINERKQAEEARRQSEAQYRNLFETSHDAIMTVSSPSWRFTSANAATIKMFGMTNEAEFIACAPWNLSPEQQPDSRLSAEKAREMIAIAVRDGSHSFEWMHRRINGEVFPAEVLLTRVALNGELLIQATVRDITNRKQIEAYREMTRESLQILNEPTTLLEAIQRIIAMLKARTGFDAVGLRLQAGEDYPYFIQQGFSPGFLKTENTLLARDANGKLCRDKNGKVSLECTCGVVISGQTDPANPLFTRGGSFWTNDSFPLLDLPPDQDPRLHPRNQCIHQGYTSVALVPIRTTDRIVGLIHLNDRRKSALTLAMIEALEGIATHIGTALMRKQMNDQLQVANQRLTATMVELQQTQQQIVQQEQLRGLRQMASGIAHNFNNALSPIIGFSELLLKYPEKRIDQLLLEKWLKNIHTCAVDAAAIVRQIREFGLQRPASREIFKSVDLNQMIQQTIELTVSRWKDQAQASGRTIQIVTDLPSVPPIRGDPSEIRGVLTNLILNAVDFMPTGGTIKLSTAVDREFVRIEVNDTGTGMTEETRQHCFEPFFSTKGVHGTGLGLSMTHSVVQRHGGTVAVVSELGQGTTFTIRFPIPRSAAPPTGSTETSALTKSLHILVVDDEPALCEVVKAGLNSDGHLVETAPNGQAALMRLLTREFDLVITDLAMPKMNGEQLAAAISNSVPGLPVILMTGFGDNMKADGEMPQHVSTILRKPITKDALREALAKVFPPQATDQR